MIMGEKMKTINLKGETFEVHGKDGEGYLLAKIKEPFYSAGKKFNWLGGSAGFSLSLTALRYCLRHKLKIRIKVGDAFNLYETTPEKWLNFTHSWRSIIEKPKVVLYCVQWQNAMFKIIRKGNKKNE